jgi:Holliday junction resolvasome RuvABC endonuclease subunit
MKRLFAVDPSLTCSGWAFFDVTAKSLLGVGRLRALGPRIVFAERLADLQQKIERVFDQMGFQAGDVLLCEAPTTMRDPRAAIAVEQVRCIFETLARSRGASVPGRINPRTVQFEVLGMTGKQVERKIVKQLAADTARYLYEKDLLRLGLEIKAVGNEKYQDILDALLIGTVGIARIESSLRTGIDLNELLEQKAHWNSQQIGRGRHV